MEPLGGKCGSSSGVNGYLPEGIDMRVLVGYVGKLGRLEGRGGYEGSRMKGEEAAEEKIWVSVFRDRGIDDTKDMEDMGSEGETRACAWCRRGGLCLRECHGNQPTRRHDHNDARTPLASIRLSVSTLSSLAIFPILFLYLSSRDLRVPLFGGPDNPTVQLLRQQDGLRLRLALGRLVRYHVICTATIACILLPIRMFDNKGQWVYRIKSGLLTMETYQAEILIGDGSQAGDPRARPKALGSDLDRCRSRQGTPCPKPCDAQAVGSCKLVSSVMAFKYIARRSRRCSDVCTKSGLSQPATLDRNH